MTEEMHNLNTDMKELFSENKLEELAELLDNTVSDTVLTITNFNYAIIKGYLNSQSFELLKQYIRFVAFVSFLCEYAGKSQLVSESDYQEMTQNFQTILEYVHQSNNA